MARVRSSTPTRSLEKRVKLTYMDAGSVQDFVSTVARVPDGTVILFLSVYEDSTGNKLLSHEVLARIAREARVPVYNQTATNVGLGVVGGVVFDPEILARETAQLTLRVLRGERLQDLPVQESKSTFRWSIGDNFADGDSTRSACLREPSCGFARRAFGRPTSGTSSAALF